MNMNKTYISENREKVLITIVLLFSLSIPLIMFRGSIDDFVPKHIVVIDQIINNGYMAEDYYTSQIPGFYIIGAMLTLITSIDLSILAFTPIQIIPYGLILFILMYKISGNYLISGLIVLIDLISGTTGTPKIFFWPHGLGTILFYTSLIVLINILQISRDNAMGKYTLLIIISSALVFMSYDLTCYYLIFIAIAIMLIFSFFLLNNDKIEKNKYLQLFKNLSTLFLIIVVILFGLSKFIYNTFIPMLKSLAVEVSVIEKFIMSYFFPKTIDTHLQYLCISYPFSITIISAIKYLLLLVSIILFMYMIVKIYMARKKLNASECIVLSIIITALFYAASRYLIGQIPVTVLYFPGILCTLWLINKRKKWSYTVVILLLLLTPLYYYIFYNNDFLNNDTSMYANVEIATEWFMQKSSQDYILKSDEMTKNLLLLNSSLNDSGYNLEQYQSMTSVDAVNLIQGSDMLPEIYYYAINYKLSTMSLENWIIIKSWRFCKDKINENRSVNKNYDSSGIAIYMT